MSETPYDEMMKHLQGKKTEQDILDEEKTKKELEQLDRLAGIYGYTRTIVGYIAAALRMPGDIVMAVFKSFCIIMISFTTAFPWIGFPFAAAYFLLKWSAYKVRKKNGYILDDKQDLLYGVCKILSGMIFALFFLIFCLWFFDHANLPREALQKILSGGDA